MIQWTYKGHVCITYKALDSFGVWNIQAVHWFLSFEGVEGAYEELAKLTKSLPSKI